MIIDLVQEYKIFCKSKNIDPYKSCSDSQFDKWVKYRNNKFPKTEWEYRFDDNYNLIRKKIEIKRYI